jgi:hypothetical protein
MTQAIFRSTAQALHVSYLVLSMPPRQGAPFRNMLIHMLEDLDDLTHQQQVWLDQLRGTPGSSTINFGGLSPDEIRAQCSMITAAVRDRLPEPERNVIWARYAYQMERASGVRGLASYYQSLIGVGNNMAMLALVWRRYAGKERADQDFSFRQIAAECGGSKSTYERANKMLTAHLRALEERADDTLTASFRAHGVIEDESLQTA